jgi:hypothetical protein
MPASWQAVPEVLAAAALHSPPGCPSVGRLSPALSGRAGRQTEAHDTGPKSLTVNSFHPRDGKMEVARPYFAPGPSLGALTFPSFSACSIRSGRNTARPKATGRSPSAADNAAPGSKELINGEL